MQNIKIKGYAVKKMLLLPIALMCVVASANSVGRATLPLGLVPIKDSEEYFLGSEIISKQEAYFYSLYQKLAARKKISCKKIDLLNASEIDALKNMAILFAEEAIWESRMYDDIGEQSKAALISLDIYKSITYCQNQKAGCC